MRIRPLRDKVLVELDPYEEWFEGGTIFRPQIAYDRQMGGTVRAAGPLCTLRRGARVVINWARGHDMAIDGRSFVMLSEFAPDDIVGVEVA